MISEQIKIERKRLNLSQTEFGEACGVGLRSQQNYENGSRTPDADYLQKAHELGVDINYLITGKPAQSNLTNQEALLLKEFGKLSDEQKQLTLGLLISGIGCMNKLVINNGPNGTVVNHMGKE